MSRIISFRTGRGTEPLPPHSGTARREPGLTAGADAAAGSHWVILRTILEERPAACAATPAMPTAACAAACGPARPRELAERPPAAPGEGQQLRDVQLDLDYSAVQSPSACRPGQYGSGFRCLPRLRLPVRQGRRQPAAVRRYGTGQDVLLRLHRAGAVSENGFSVVYDTAASVFARFEDANSGGTRTAARTRTAACAVTSDLDHLGKR